MRHDLHAAVLGLALSGARDAAHSAMWYANARTPGSPGFTFDEEPTEAGLHKMRPVFVCCFEHRETCRPSGPDEPCRLVQLYPAEAARRPRLYLGADFGATPSRGGLVLA